jgi:antirestriction protein ArdC
MSKNFDIYQAVTDRIIEGLKKGVIVWRKTWKQTGGFPVNYASKKHYHGINVLILWFHMEKHGFTQPYYLTFNQIKKLKGSVKKGSQSEIVVYWQFLEKDTGEKDKNGKPIIRRIPLLKYYRVFNIQQTDIKIPEAEKPIKEFQQIENAENFVAGYKDKPAVRHGGRGGAYYNPVQDFINMPEPESFETEADYYCTLFHELTHSTGHKDRLNRDEVVGTDGFGGEKYSKEELTAEIGTAFICSLTGISNEKLEENQQAYINGWIKALENQPKMILIASNKAQKAVNYMQGLVKAEQNQEQEAGV